LLIIAEFFYQTLLTFDKYENTGIIAFQEVKGIFKTDQEALLQSNNNKNYFTK
jgi:CRISPR/Cas system CMR subunit Cmr6 (Cas7 group RAMP superfamily)